MEVLGEIGCDQAVSDQRKAGASNMLGLVLRFGTFADPLSLQPSREGKGMPAGNIKAAARRVKSKESRAKSLKQNTERGD